MTTPMATFARASANAEPMPDGRDAAAAQAAGLKMFAERAEYVGLEEVEGRQAYHLRATGLQDIPIDDAGGDDVRLDNASLYVDPEEYVVVKMVMEMSAESDGQRVAMTIERLDQEYKKVGDLYLPHVQILRIGGLDEAMAEQMQELQAQLEQLPPSMRGMIESQMKNAMNQYEAMIVTDVIIPNTGVPSYQLMAEAMAGAWTGG